MKSQIILILFCLVNNTVSSQNSDFLKLERYFDKVEKHNMFCGNITVTQNGKKIYSRSVGHCNMKPSKANNSSSLHRIGSISKSMTAVLVLKAVELGKLSLEETLDNYYPQIPNASKITIEHLLRHQSGIYNFTNDPQYLLYHESKKTKLEMIDTISKYDSQYEPGLRSSYSNSNYVVLTCILERCFESEYALILEKYITKPLNLVNTYQGTSIEKRKNECSSYEFDSTWIATKRTDLSIPMGAGSVISTAEEVAIFSDGLFDNKLISSASVDRMKSIKGQYGMGLATFPFYNKTAFGHDGAIDGFSSIYGHFDEEDISFAITSNGSVINTNDVSIAVLSAAFGKDFDIPSFAKIDESLLSDYSGFYTSEAFPLDITVFDKNGQLFAQATGQGAFPLTMIKTHEFEFKQANIHIQFIPLEKKLTLTQGGLVNHFTK